MTNPKRFIQHAFFSVILLLYINPSVVCAKNGGAKMIIKCIEKERQALLKFQQGLVDDSGRLLSWGSKDCCTWSGVHCNNITGHVVALDLHNQYYAFLPLTGIISPSLLQLQHLNYLDLSSNYFGDTEIPEFIGSLTQLQYLNLAENNFVGEIPYHFGNLTKLRFLDLGFNVLTVMNLDWLPNLRMLSYLDMSSVNFTNVNWLQAVNKLSFLRELRLSMCGLSGVTPVSIPLTNSSSMNLAVVDLSENGYVSSSEFRWLFNFSSSLVDIDISSNSLRGPIPDAFGDIVSLMNLNLASNALEGEIPESFGKMLSLTSLYLRDNLLEGEIPVSFGRNLSHLELLELSGNNFRGQLHDFLKGLSGVATSSLESLRLADNQLSGSLPDITNFSALTTLSLRINQLNGTFPESFGQVSSLVLLDLSSNQMTGSLPDFTLFKSLKHLDLSSNQLQGRLPKSIGQLSELEILDVSYNSLEDTLSEAYFSNLSNLKILHLSFNSLALEFSSDWLPPFQLDVIRVAYCRLGTHFPRWLQTQNNYSELDISYAGISDKVPNWFWELSPNLKYLNLSYNQMSGVVPDLSSKFVAYPSIDLNSNHFEGLVPPFPLDLTSLHLSKNMFSGSISFLCSIANGYFTSLDLSDNQLSGELPDCWMQMEELVILNLANNNFSGKIPSSMGSLYQLETLYLRNNNFIGGLPLSLKSCSKLIIVDLGQNKLSGNVPAWIGTHLTSLIVLSLRLNELSGSIPTQICHLNHIQLLDLSRNNISGRIPFCFNNFTSLVQRINSSGGTLVFNITAYEGYYFDGGDFVGNALVQWKRRELEYKKNLGLLKSIDLSSNKLAGGIPQEFASLRELISLNLSRNCLTGNIIQKIDQLKMLESLDLSQNQLSGAIPVGFVRLSYLSVLDLSNNNLSGKIPSSTQLQSFNASNFAGNLELCGLPLPNKCSGDETPTTEQGKDNNLQEDEDRLITPGFYLSAGLGFAVGFWAVFGTFLLKLSSANFKFLDKIKVHARLKQKMLLECKGCLASNWNIKRLHWSIRLLVNLFNYEDGPYVCFFVTAASVYSYRSLSLL